MCHDLGLGLGGSEDVAFNQRIEQLIDECLEISSRVCEYCLVPMDARKELLPDGNLRNRMMQERRYAPALSTYSRLLMR